MKRITKLEGQELVDLVMLLRDISKHTHWIEESANKAVMLIGRKNLKEAEKEFNDMI